MCKKRIVLALMISFGVLCACGRSYISDRDMDIYEKLHKYYNEMESFCATLEITAYSNKTENTYVAEQKVICPDLYFMKIGDKSGSFSVTTIQNGETVKTAVDGSDYALTVPGQDSTGMLFVNRFFERYYASEDTVLSVSSTKEGRVTVLETVLPENHPKMSKARLTVDNETLAPIEIVLTDEEGAVVLKGTFLDFTYNDTVNREIFTTDT